MISLTCQHYNFEAKVEVLRHVGGGRLLSAVANVTIRCKDCNEELRFVDLDEFSADHKTARLRLNIGTDSPLGAMEGALSSGD